MKARTFKSDIRQLAYNQLTGNGPGVVFLPGFRSNMEGDKALFLEDWAQNSGRAFLRFDYSGHGASSGDITDGAIGDWADDAEAIISAVTEGPQILVGSSMGGWIALLLARRMPKKVAGIVTIAAAPDFTERRLNDLSSEDRATFEETGQVEVPTPYEDDPHILTRKLVEDGARHAILNDDLDLPGPVRFLHGAADDVVPQEVALKLFERAKGSDASLLIVKGADHRFSTPECLKLIRQAIESVTREVEK